MGVVQLCSFRLCSLKTNDIFTGQWKLITFYGQPISMDGLVLSLDRGNAIRISLTLSDCEILKYLWGKIQYYDYVITCINRNLFKIRLWTRIWILKRSKTIIVSISNYKYRSSNTACYLFLFNRENSFLFILVK